MRFPDPGRIQIAMARPTCLALEALPSRHPRVPNASAVTDNATWNSQCASLKIRWRHKRQAAAPCAEGNKIRARYTTGQTCSETDWSTHRTMDGMRQMSHAVLVLGLWGNPQASCIHQALPRKHNRSEQHQRQQARSSLVLLSRFLLPRGGFGLVRFGLGRLQPLPHVVGVLAVRVVLCLPVMDAAAQQSLSH